MSTFMNIRNLKRGLPEGQIRQNEDQANAHNSSHNIFSTPPPEIS